jgi:hypothetical protein
VRIDLPSLLPPHHYLMRSNQSRYGSYTVILREGFMDKMQCFLAERELLCFNEFLAHYPAYAPYENLLAILYNEPLETARNEYHEHPEARHVKTLRTHISKMRWKLIPLGVDIVAQPLLGYELKSLYERLVTTK